MTSQAQSDTTGEFRQPVEQPSAGASAFSKQEALDRLGGDEEILREAVTMFLGRIPAYREALAGALKCGDFDALRTLAHTLKSTSATVGAAALRTQFITLENASRKKDAETALSIIAQIESEFSRYREAVSSGR
jgi:HPt (histidine-containing phosphotransfer) domain-containing protein